MSGAQRAFWVDLLALAGRSRYPGIICSGRDGDHYVGYPLKTVGALDAGAEIDLLSTFELFAKTEKITVEMTAKEPVELYKVTICNWERYQSEYQRQKRHRKRELQLSDRKSDTKGHATEGEGDTEPEGEEKQQSAAAFRALGFEEPFGRIEFRKVRTEEYKALSENPDGTFTDAMERTMQRCKSVKIPVPPLFFNTNRKT